MIAKLSKGGSFSGAVQYIFRSREGRRLPGRDGRSVQGHALHHPRVRTAGCAKPQGLETRGTRCSLLFASGCRPVEQPTAALHCGGVSGPDGDQGYTTYHCPPPRPGTSPPAYSLQPRGQRRTNDLRPQRPLPFGAALQATDRPLRTLPCIGQGAGQGVPAARTGQDEIRNLPCPVRYRPPAAATGRS